MYSTEINGETTEFGTSGMLYRSNKLMYDRATETLWHQFRGEPVVGPLANSGIRLKVLPNVLTTWEEWLSQHPDTTVISDDTGVYPPDLYRTEEDPSSIYFSYRAASDTMFPVAFQDDSLAVKEQIFGLVFGDQARAYSRNDLTEAEVVNDTLGGQELVVITTANGGSRAYERKGLTFRFSSENQLVDATGEQWLILENAMESVSDPAKRLLRLPSKDAYWFGWYAFYPQTDVYVP